MPRIFHRRANTISRVTIYGAIIIITFIMWALAEVRRSPYATRAFVVGRQVAAMLSTREPMASVFRPRNFQVLGKSPLAFVKAWACLAPFIRELKARPMPPPRDPHLTDALSEGERRSVNRRERTFLGAKASPPATRYE